MKMRSKTEKQILLVLLMIWFALIAFGCKKDNPSPNISGDYTANCIRKDPNTGHQSPYSDLNWKITQTADKFHKVENLLPNGSYHPRPFQKVNITVNNDGTFDLNETYYKGTGTHSKTGMFWSFTQYLTNYEYNWDCTCIKN